ncbi:hypothetical protein EKO04_006693 [Ascochyta lentis]|uniref:Uncharacterized protein n=1 Tax=Ascochyta lentis TaxID=205686 RepID=A0A8H7J063_9PLEO|nr:hypothetical protein EKO04_006693 [Ascochyta lentis]
MAQQELTEQQLALIADRARVWEVRRFCQVLPSVVEYERGNETVHGTYSGREPNGALAALLRCVIYHLGADLAMVSLLDDHNQYFVSGASRHNLQDVKVTLDSTRWYGCESVKHHGGLCERTITQQDCSGNKAFYEELDMVCAERTQNLPFVNGEIAGFRHYAGVPLSPYGGPNVGTVFLFSEKPSEASRSDGIRSFLAETADHITRHLEQAVEAMEGKRAESFLKSESGRQQLVSNLYPDSSLYVYSLAATLLCDIFEFDGVKMQKAGLSRDNINTNPSWNGSSTIAQNVRPSAQVPGEPTEALLERLLDMFPHGAVFHIAADSSDVIAATVMQRAAVVIDDTVSAELLKTFPNVEQMILMPLWETYHKRNVGAVFGFVYRLSNVYLSTTDLSSVSALCTTTMTQVRRLEVQATDQIKSDFLGSISHEMRTPLHGILSSLELLADTPHNEYQHDLLNMAQYSGTSLLDTIDRVLYFSGVSSAAQLSGEPFAPEFSGRQSPLPTNRTPASSPEAQTSGLIYVCETNLHQAAQRFHLKRTVRPELFRPRRSFDSHHSPSATGSRSGAMHPVILFDTNAAWSCRLTAVTSFKTVFTNLLDNALKFGDPAGCVCIHLDIDQSSVKISFTDTGKGVAPDFIHHVILDPFSQEDPLDEGIGLGLANAKHAVGKLGGRMLIDSNERSGSTFTVTFPSNRISYEPTQDTSEFRSIDSQSSVAELPVLEMSLFMPRRWETEDTMRGDRCASLVLETLMRGVSRSFQTTATLWRPPSALPHLLFILLEDLDHVIQTCGDAVIRTKLVVLCPDAEKTPNLEKMSLRNATTILGPITFSSLCKALKRLFPSTISCSCRQDAVKETQNTLEHEKKHAMAYDITKPSAGTGSDDMLPRMLSDLALRRAGSDIGAHVSPAQMISFKTKWPDLSDEASYERFKTSRPYDAMSSSHAQPVASSEGDKQSNQVNRALREPKLLLVDDNLVNLKALAMFARKCSGIPSISASSGQEAIDAFNHARNSDDSTTPQGYDLIFLDLSMPEMSGFEVAKKIRQTEASLERKSRTYICALTGLTSTNDRNRAFSAGVDQYIVKPVKLKDLQAVISCWQDIVAEQ